MNAAEAARASIDAAHARDPHRLPDGRPAELVYADRIEAWVARLDPSAGELLRLAARCQHLERFDTPRSGFPEGRAGYLAWRKSLYGKQAARCAELLRAAGFSDRDAEAAAAWVAKEGLRKDPGAQILEDAACLVFLEKELQAFAADHADYPRDKFVAILRKTWRKMSPAAQAFARQLHLTPAVAELLREAAGAP